MGSVFGGAPKVDSSAQDAMLARENERAAKLDAEEASRKRVQSARRSGRQLLAFGETAESELGDRG
jgi:hypothetical protein